MRRYYSEQQHNSRLKARRARLSEARRMEERERLAFFGITSHPTSPLSFSQSYPSRSYNIETVLYWYLSVPVLYN
jgi:hypothetical protein